MERGLRQESFVQMSFVLADDSAFAHAAYIMPEAKEILGTITFRDYTGLIDLSAEHLKLTRV